jgi:hypothetical protein
MAAAASGWMAMWLDEKRRAAWLVLVGGDAGAVSAPQ